jgi:hypothetical protein
MKNFAIALVLLMLGSLSFAQSDVDAANKRILSAPLVDGDYVGLEKIENYESHVKWFHENTLLIRNGEVILDKLPLTIKHGKKSYSASDGGFLTYRGRFFKKDGQTFISLRLFQSDYVAFPVNGCEPYSKIKVSPIKLSGNAIEIEGVLYKLTTVPEERRKGLLETLHNEPMEYTGERPYRTDMKMPTCK